jgi:hypothetical protein
MTREQLCRYVRAHVRSQFYDDSVGERVGTAIYALSDPRELQAIRYVGQTRAPRRRFMQHVNTARLWLPDEKPFWVKAPELRPLYEWIRGLFQDEQRLPTMVVQEWVETASQARIRERARICECLEQRLPLFNVEAEIAHHQPILL